MSAPTNLQEFCVALIGHAVKTYIEPKCNNVKLWENGAGALAAGVVQQFVPNVTGDEVAARALAMMGVRPVGRPISYRLPDAPKVIDVTGGPV